MKHAWINNETDAIVKVRDYPEDWKASDVKHKFGSDHAIRIIPIEVDADLKFDKLTHKQVSERVIMATKVRDKKTLVPHSTNELQAIADRETRKLKKSDIKGNKNKVKEWIKANDKNKLPELYQMFVDIIEALELDR